MLPLQVSKVNDNYTLFSLMIYIVLSNEVVHLLLLRYPLSDIFYYPQWPHQSDSSTSSLLSLSSPVVDSVTRAGAEVKDRVTLEVEDGGLGRHEAEHGAEVGGVGTPGHVVDWTLLGCLDTCTCAHTH